MVFLTFSYIQTFLNYIRLDILYFLKSFIRYPFAAVFFYLIFFYEWFERRKSLANTTRKVDPLSKNDKRFDSSTIDPFHRAFTRCVLCRVGKAWFNVAGRSFLRNSPFRVDYRSSCFYFSVFFLKISFLDSIKHTKSNVNVWNEIRADPNAQLFFNSNTCKFRR